MTRKSSSIDFGIDLGTTNSAIAFLNGVNTEIVKNNDEQDITPSAVAINKKGIVNIGSRAKNRMAESPSDVVTEFKRRMGTDFQYEFPASGKSHSSEELSAEVIKALRSSVEQRRGILIESAVITVPAAFELHQCEATQKAAKMAGLTLAPLLQEPVAAALAYGFQQDETRSYWLVYDFGGGTFDAALVKSEEGLINVVNHHGNNFLGGADIDWAILEKIVFPALRTQFNLSGFERGSKRWSQEINKLKAGIESAKIDLSRMEKVYLEWPAFEDESGDEVSHDELEIELTQSQIADIAEPMIRKSAMLCEQVIKEKGLSASDIEKMILVGGPTLAPYFREIIAEALPIEIDHSVDPMTVVARGAAIFAGTQRVDVTPPKASKAGEFVVDLKYKPVGQEVDPLVGGRVEAHGGASTEGVTIEITNTESKWSSGKVPLSPEGAFMTNILAETGKRNTFSIDLKSSSGASLDIRPDQFNYTVGAAIEEQTIANAIGVAKANNTVAEFFDKGIGLPAKKMVVLRTAHALSRGESGKALKIPVIEGGNALADRNRVVGNLEINSHDISRDLPNHSEIEVTLKVNESRKITVEAYVPLLDEEFETELVLVRPQASAVSIEQWKESFRRERERFRELRKKAELADDQNALRLLGRLDQEEVIDDLSGKLRGAEGDQTMAEQFDKNLLEFKVALDEVEGVLEWPILVKKAEEAATLLENLVQEHGSPEMEEKAEELADRLDDIIERKDVERLKKHTSRIEELYFQVLAENPAFWVTMFKDMAHNRAQMTDPARAQQLISQGNRCIADNEIDGLRNVCVQLIKMLPKDIQEEVQQDRGLGAGVI
jgi:molecular chaperone DnaK